MTCIVGISDNGKVYLGADSSATAGWEVRTTKLPKVFQKGQFTIGYTTSFRMGQILQHHLRVVQQDAGCSNMGYMVCVFIEAVRDCLKKHGFTRVEDNVEEAGTFLVAYKGAIYEIGSDFQVNHYADNIAACGCGSDFALGALMALERSPPEERILRALEVAAYFSGAVTGPFTVICSLRGEEDGV